jgi:hypothetical protein
MREQRRRGSIAHGVAGPIGRFPNHLHSKIFLGVLELDFFGDGDAIVTYDGPAKFLLSEDALESGGAICDVVMLWTPACTLMKRRNIWPSKTCPYLSRWSWETCTTFFNRQALALLSCCRPITRENQARPQPRFLKRVSKVSLCN